MTITKTLDRPSNPAYILSQLRATQDRAALRSHYVEAIATLAAYRRRTAWDYVKFLEHIVELQEKAMDHQGIEIAESYHKVKQLMESERLLMEKLEQHLSTSAARELATTDQYPNTHKGVICDDHGKQGLTDEDYSRQLAKPDNVWICPVCHDVAQWDDDRYEAGETQP